MSMDNTKSATKEMSDEQLLALALKQSRQEKEKLQAKKEPAAPAESGFSFLSGDGNNDDGEETSFSFISAEEPGTGDTGFSFASGGDTGFSFTGGDEDASASGGFSFLTAEKTETASNSGSSPAHDIFAALIFEHNTSQSKKEATEASPEETEPEPMTSMFGGLSIDNDDGGLLSLDQPEEIVEEEIKYETRSAVQPEPKLESEPNVVPASQPQIKLRKESYREPEPTYEDCLEDQFKRLKSSCERQGEKLWQQIQRNQDQHSDMSGREERLEQTLEEKKQDCIVLEKAQEQAIIEEDYDLAAEKDKSLTRKKNEISRIKRDIRSVRKSLKENITKKNKNFSMLRSIHIETTSGAEQYCEKYKNKNYEYFKEQKKEIDQNVSHLQARFDRAARILQIGHEDLETVLEKETVILNTIKEQNKDIMEEKEKLEENKAKLDKDIEALMEKIRFKEAEVLEVESVISDLSLAIEEAKSEFGAELQDIDTKRQRLVNEQQEHMNDQSRIKEEIEEEKCRKEAIFSSEEIFNGILDEVESYSNNLQQTSNLVLELEEMHTQWESTDSINQDTIVSLNKKIDELNSDERQQQLDALTAEIDATMTHLALIENQIPMLQSQKAQLVSQKKFREAGATHKTIKSLKNEKDQEKNNLLELQAKEESLRETCLGQVTQLQTFKDKLQDAHLSRDTHRFEELKYMMSWIQRFLKYIENNGIIVDVFRKDLDQCEKEKEILKLQYGWEETEEKKAEAIEVEPETVEEVEPEEKKEEVVINVEELMAQCEELHAQIEENSELITTALEEEDFEDAARLQEVIDTMTVELEETQKLVEEHSKEQEETKPEGEETEQAEVDLNAEEQSI